MEWLDSSLDGLTNTLKQLLSPFAEIGAIFSNPWISFGLVAVVFVGLFVYCVLRYHTHFSENIRNPKILVFCSVMIAISVVLSYFTLRFSAYLRVGFGYITQPVVGSFLGPLFGGILGILQDLLSFLLNPTGGFLPAYTLSMGICGMLYGMMLFRKPVTVWRVFLAELLVTAVGNILLNSIAIAPTAGSGLAGILPARILKNLLLLPIHTVLDYVVLKALQKIKPISDLSA